MDELWMSERGRQIEIEGVEGMDAEKRGNKESEKIVP